MHMTATAVYGPIKSYYEADNKIPTRAICLREIKVNSPDGKSEFFYARGSATCSYDDRPNKKIGRRIAAQRMSKVVEWFQSQDYDCTTYHYTLKFAKEPDYEGGTRQRMHMQLLEVDGLSDFEKKLLGLDDKKKEALPNDDPPGGMPGGVR